MPFYLIDMGNRQSWLLVLATLALPALAQSPAPDKPAPTASISGHVYCADTNAPARMATVMLEAASGVDDYTADAKEPPAIHITSVQTLLDGSFVLQHVTPGAYYVLASAPGYVSPLASIADTEDDLRKPDKATKAKYRQLVPRVTVQGNLGATVDLRLERGAAVSGTIHYDDGSPATGLAVRPLVKQKDKWQGIASDSPQSSFEARTDDQGHYRISGLPPREYLMEVQLHLSKTLTEYRNGGMGSSSSDIFMLPIYTGGVFRTSDVKPFSVKLGEERPDEDIDIPLGKLHSVSGNITAARDGHVVNSGEVALLHSDDRSELAKVSLQKDESTFNFSFVPEGDYILKSSGAADVEFEEVPNPPGTMPPTNTKETTLHKYGPSEQPIHIAGDMAGTTVAVPENAAGAVTATSASP